MTPYDPQSHVAAALGVSLRKIREEIISLQQAIELHAICTLLSGHNIPKSADIERFLEVYGMARRALFPEPLAQPATQQHPKGGPAESTLDQTFVPEHGGGRRATEAAPTVPDGCVP